jgi:hypothetical protein
MAQILFPRAVRLRGVRQPVWPQVDETHPINRGLVGYWQCDGEGVLQPDYSGAGNNGVATATGLQDSHHGGNALSFNGTSSNVIAPANASILGGTPRTFAAWVNLASNTPARGIFTYGSTSAGGAANDLWTGFTNAGDVYFRTIGNDVRTTSGGAIPTNTWTHLAVVYLGGNLSASTLLIYVNAALQAGTTVGPPTTLVTLSSPVHIGDDISVTVSPFSGAIEGVRWYNRALSATEIQQLYTEPYIGIVDALASIIPTGVPPQLPLMGQIWLA